MFAFVGCDNEEAVEKTGLEKIESVGPELSDVQRKVKTIADTENLLQSLSSEMKAIAGSFAEDGQPLPFVEANLEYQGLIDKQLSDLLKPASSDGLPFSSFEWPISSDTTQASLSKVLSPLVSVGRIADIKIGTVKGTFLAPDKFEMETKLEGRLVVEDGKAMGVKGYQTLGWSNKDGWKLSSWKQKKLKIIAASKTLFENVTESAIPDKTTRDAVLRSSHQELILANSAQANEDGKFKQARPQYKGFSDWYSAFQYPSVSVLDIDSDGHDDLFVTDRWQPAQLLRNRGDGTFEDWTEKSGLKIDELANCVYFADFDNDGDSDAFVGISLGSSKFFKNEGGTFVLDEANTKVVEDSRFVVAASVVDINRDGLLDLYLSTYAFGDGPVSEWYSLTTRDKDQIKTLMRLKSQHSYVDRGGPPNIVLMNRGGKFEWSPIDDEAKLFRDTYQTGWTDIDEDGDLDAYVCNDFAPDVFLRNDTEQGSFKPKFVDATSTFIGQADMNFSMGSSWGDFDSDGDLDLYVSNMYSKAGTRICARMDTVDERVKVSARGNFLYENSDGKLTQIAGQEDANQHVAVVGWSFGGQFADFDNDGQLDLYVPSGFYSPPKEVHTDKDL